MAGHRPLLAVLFALLMPCLAQADIYKWYDANGVLTFGDHPPPGVEAVKVKGASPAASSPARSTSPAPSTAGIRSFLEHRRQDRSASGGNVAPRRSGGSNSASASAGKDHGPRHDQVKDRTEVKQDYRERMAAKTRPDSTDDSTGDSSSSNRVKTPKTLSQKKAARIAARNKKNSSSD